MIHLLAIGSGHHSLRIRFQCLDVFGETFQLVRAVKNVRISVSEEANCILLHFANRGLLLMLVSGRELTTALGGETNTALSAATSSASEIASWMPLAYIGLSSHGGLCHLVLLSHHIVDGQG